MATVSDADYPKLDMREQLVRIDKMQAELNKIQIEMTKLHVDTDQVRLDTRLAPWTLVITSLGAGAALFAAGAAFTKLLIG
uniref:hypothetical protein n=1 Tax=uncultured Sphingomonas sp. TaxID=158754 RepID=UPI0035CA7CE3